MKKLLISFILIIGIVFVAGCVSKENAIVGKWLCQKSPGITGTIQFFKDGTVTEMPGELTGNYHFVDDTHLRVDFGSQSKVVSVSISGNELIFESVPCQKVDSK
jgi:hypothetical protein